MSIKSPDVEDIGNDIELVRARIRTLQAETIHCITIKPSGKIEIVDKQQLECINGEIESLKALEARNGEVLEKIQADLQEAGYASIKAAKSDKSLIENSITRIEDLYRMDVADLLERGPKVTPENVLQSPKGSALKAEHDKKIAELQGRLAPITAALNRVQVIIADFKPSGIEPNQQADYHHVIARAGPLGVV